MMCFYGAYFAYLITGCYYYYEKFSARTNFNLDHFVELYWMLFSTLSHVCVIATSVTINREVAGSRSLEKVDLYKLPFQASRTAVIVHKIINQKPGLHNVEGVSRRSAELKRGNGFK